ncbi:MAG: hypothetical protein VX923_04815 [Pseudomonadota bacterium]|nr:hypothetical protein [Pseudomonadota bacterium]
MLGFSIQKILFTVFVIAAVWYGYKWIGRIKARRDKGFFFNQKNSKESSSKGIEGAEEMIECVTCRTFIADSCAKSCGRTDCPYPG